MSQIPLMQFKQSDLVTPVAMFQHAHITPLPISDVAGQQTLTTHEGIYYIPTIDCHIAHNEVATRNHAYILKGSMVPVVVKDGGYISVISAIDGETGLVTFIGLV